MLRSTSSPVVSTDSSQRKRDTLSSEDAAALNRALGAEIEGEVRFDKIFRAIHSTDASVYQIMPLGVVIPRSTDDVIRTVHLCNQYGASITARGGGTSQAGQAIGTGVGLDFSKYMNRLIDMNLEEATVRVQPGIVLDELNSQLKPHGLQLPLDLSTSNRATVGGMIANNSSGTRSVIYGKTIDYVIELTVVLADGSTVRMCPVDDGELRAKGSGSDREAACYRIVEELGAVHEDEIHRRYPKILRRVGGYNLDEFTSFASGFNLARIMVGSEGTLGLIVEAKMRLVAIPKARVVAVVQFDSLLESMAATPVILEHGPSAIELIDRFILDTTRGKIKFEPLRDFIIGDPGAILIVEFFGESADELPERVDVLEKDLRERGLGGHIHRCIDPSAQAPVWELRKGALGLSMSQRGDAKSISFVEDTAVDPSRLHDYIERFLEILRKHDTEAGFYAHASVGLLHVRPVVNMKIADGIEKFSRIAEEIADLVLEYGGALSGEHGDGLVRAPFQEKMFGPALYDAFRQVKQTFDPEGLLNPGKIVDSPPITHNLRFGTAYETRRMETAYDFSDFGGIAGAAEQCSGVGACRKSLSGTMCPSYMATRDEADTTRGRANALRLAISGALGPEGFSDKGLYPILDLCLECKACKSECPTGVDMARLKNEFLHQWHTKHGVGLRARFLARVDDVARWGSRLAPASNWLAGNSAIGWLNEKLLGLDRRRKPPVFARRTFLDWWARHANSNGPSGMPPSSSVAIFPDTFSNYHEPEGAIGAVRLAERLGARVEVAPQVCCGRPLISKGFLDEAASQAALTTEALTPLVERGLPILFCEPSCYSAVRDDHPNILRGLMKEKAEKVAAACDTFEEWAISALAESKRVEENGGFFRAGPKRILLHGHCHQKALVGIEPSIRLLSMVSDCQVTALDSGCCGMAGSFGYEREHYEVSQAIGERVLFPAVRGAEPQTVIVAPGFSCRHQIKHFTGVDALSPMVLLDGLTAHE